MSLPWQSEVLSHKPTAIDLGVSPLACCACSGLCHRYCVCVWVWVGGSEARWQVQPVVLLPGRLVAAAAWRHPGGGGGGAQIAHGRKGEDVRDGVLVDRDADGRPTRAPLWAPHLGVGGWAGLPRRHARAGPASRAGPAAAIRGRSVRGRLPDQRGLHFPGLQHVLPHLDALKTKHGRKNVKISTMSANFERRQEKAAACAYAGLRKWQLKAVQNGENRAQKCRTSGSCTCWKELFRNGCGLAKRNMTKSVPQVRVCKAPKKGDNIIQPVHRSGHATAIPSTRT